MALRFGLHTRPQFLSLEELRRAWIRADEARFSWISVADRVYPHPLEDRRQPCFEAVAMMAHLAGVTEHARVGCLMFNVAFRHPGVLVKAITTIDHISGGRAEFGIGAGTDYHAEHPEYGISAESSAVRMGRVEEALQLSRLLLSGEPVDFSGAHYRLSGAVCAPKPLNPHLRIWVGGQGARRTPRVAARFADGLNVPYMTASECAERFQALDGYCEEEGRDPGTIERSVSMNFYMGANDARAARNRREFEAREPRKAGALLGTVAEVVDTIGEYHRAGAETVNMVFRHSIDWDAYESFIEEVVPQFDR